MDSAQLQAAYRSLLDAAATVTGSDDATAPPPGEWTADQILAHVSLVTATTIAAASTVASGSNTAYDNRIALDTWTIDRVITLTGGTAGLLDRLRHQADALCALAGPTLSDTELDTPVPTRLLSNGTCLVDQLVPLRDLLTGLAESELPGHTRQLLALLPDPAPLATTV
ncbi:DinB family protein [Actinomadura oligospora]|uniref:DinB family protein n=1 Tax=Actinomadura oligospora TaxID=111804 RepID=UPI0004B3D7C8|nr:DinB family protein [Actinomadura oligospora]